MQTSIFADDFKAEPYWWEAARPYDLQQGLPSRVDVLIVGSGFCGLSAGRRCLELGRSVLVVDAGPIGGFASSRSGAMVSIAQKMLLTGKSRHLDGETLRSAIQMHEEAFEHLRSLACDEKLDFDFQQSGRLFLAANPADAPLLQRHADTLRARAGVAAAVLDRSALKEEIGTDRYFGGMLVDQFGGIHPSKLGLALSRAFSAGGGLLSSYTRVEAVLPEANAFRILTNRGEIVARDVLFATNGYTDGALPHLRRRLAPAGSQIIATEPLAPALMNEIMPRRRMYSDSKRALWYFRPSPEGDRVLFGGRPYAWPVSLKKAAEKLQEGMCSIFPQLAGTRISHCWGGNGAMTLSGLQRIGTYRGVHFAVGCNGSGAVIMPYLGRLAAERMLGFRAEPTVFERGRFAAFPPYGEQPWFVSLVVAGYHLRDWRDRRALAA